ncbi:hypothetical protein AAAW81_07605 [Bifidobacterium adolescentis]
MERDLNVFTAGGVADGDGSRQADLKGFAGAGVPAFLIEREEIGIRGRANRRSTSAPTVYVKQDVVGAWIIIDIQLWFPPADMSERGCPRKISQIWFVFVGLSAGGKSFSRVARI